MSTSPESGKAATDAEIAERITNALVIKNVNVRSLAEETGISYNRLRIRLKGEGSLTFAEFGKIADAIKVKPSSLLPDTLARRTAA